MPPAKRTKAKAAVEPEPAGSSKRRRVAAPAKEKAIAGSDLFLFGSNPFGALGMGEDVSVKGRPAAIPDFEEKFLQVECGGMHTVALSASGEVWTWGVNDEGALGRKTGGSAWEKEPESGKADSTTPGKAVLPAGVKATQVAAGDGFTLVLADDGALYGFGLFKDDVSNLQGFPGASGGKTPDLKAMQRLPVKVYGAETVRDRVRKIAAGARHAAALTARGDVLTFGIGSQGQLGRVPAYTQLEPPPLELLMTPTPVPGVSAALGGHPVVDIACGAYNTFVVAKDGGVAAFGLNNSGQLGLPVVAGELGLVTWRPTALEELPPTARVAAGHAHTLALTKKGVLLSFGSPTYGMLGRRGVDVTTANAALPEAEAVDGLEGQEVVSMACGYNVSACTTSDGSLFLWGSQVNYQLAKGQEDDDDCHLPERFRRTKTFGFRRIHHVSIGGQHAALLAGPPEQPPADSASPAAGGSAPPAGAATAAH